MTIWNRIKYCCINIFIKNYISINFYNLIATNRFHVQRLLQVVNEIIFCFDGDDAGRGAAWGALINVLPVVVDGTEIKFLFLPEGEDPASLLEKGSAEDFKEKVKDAKLKNISDLIVAYKNNGPDMGN